MLLDTTFILDFGGFLAIALLGFSPLILIHLTHRRAALPAMRLRQDLSERTTLDWHVMPLLPSGRSLSTSGMLVLLTQVALSITV